MSQDDNVTGADLNITFTDNTFSIRCGKCADIHNAQLEGKTNKPCDCKCHSEYKPYIPYVPYCPPDPCCPTIPYWGDNPFISRQPTTGDPLFRFQTYSGTVDPTVGSGYAQAPDRGMSND